METIDLISFLKKYYGITSEMLSFNKLTHKDVMALFPYVDENDKKEITLEEIIRGDVIGVYDKTKRVVYYYNPLNKVDNVTLEYKTNNLVLYYTLEDLENLSRKELLRLRKELKQNDQDEETYTAIALIKKRKRREPKSSLIH